MSQKTFSARPSDVTRKWFIVDASEASLGRVATKIATLLIGKGKPTYTHHIDVGDFVVVVNAANLKVTGNKLEAKTYYRHSGFPGGLHETSLKEILASSAPERALYEAVRGMLPVNKLRDERLKRLKIYATNEHKHAAQKPEAISVKGIK
ncbi:MAG TPA: 50S ribosomal protein L13 [Verrucomicrobiae bacterium]|nr:50S ribosomal protein L13 [Verrucomicrobiae bacterium]